MDPYRSRARSQSRFPPIDEHPGGFPAGQPLNANQRSKSLDNRKEFEHGLDDDFSYDRSLERNSTLHASMPRRQRGGDFFNETITIPTQQSGRSSSKQYVNQRERDEAADDDYTSYDKKVRYQHEKTIYPSQPRYDRYYEDRNYYRSPPPAYPPQGLSPRSVASKYPESDYYQQRSQRIQQHRPLDYSRSADAQSGYHRETVERSAGAGAAAGEYRYFDEESANVAPAHRAVAAEAAAARSSVAAAGGGAGGGHRSHQYHYESHGGGTGGRHGYSNGGQFKEKRSGGFWGAGRQQQQHPQEPRVYHKIHCCCFSFKWPPFSYEECEPPRPMYPKPPKPANPPPPPQY